VFVPHGFEIEGSLQAYAVLSMGNSGGHLQVASAASIALLNQSGRFDGQTMPRRHAAIL
jgi:hypothetical protein